MHRITKLSLAAALALASVAWLTGCGKGPSSPGANEFRDPQFVRVVPRPGTLESGPTGPASGSAEIQGELGGRVNVGRFAVTVPPGAFKGLASVSITVPDQMVLQCALDIAPVTANSFSPSVVLEIDYAGTDVTDPSALMNLWYDEMAGTWRQLPGTQVDTERMLVSAPLSHFSLYGIVEGKAGW